nr:MAG: Zn finger protein [uncultured archaeon]
MLAIKCMKCSEKAKKNILFDIKDFLISIPLPNRMRKGKCPNCGFEILIEG